MLRPVPMVHFRAQVPNRDAAAATRAIASEGLLHLVDVAHGRAPYDTAPPGVRDLYTAFRDLQQRIHSLCDRLGVVRGEIEGGIGEEVADFAAERERITLLLEPIEKRVQALIRDRAAAHDRVVAAKEAAIDAERVHRAAIDVERLLKVRFAVVQLGVVKADALPSISAMLSPLPHAIVPLEENEDGIFFAAAVPATSRTRVEEAMRVALAQPVKAGPVDKAPAATQGDEAVAVKAIDDERAKSEALLCDLAKRIEMATLLLQAQTFFAAAGRFIVISGFVPEANAAKLRDRVRAATHDRAIVEIEPVQNAATEAALRVPILHRNPLLLRPFQKLVDMYGTPSYQEVEPTAFFAFSFLAMFGLMFGDVGHGAVLFSAGWLLFRYVPRFLDYGILLMEAGAASTIFGFLYGMVFGFRGVLPVLWLEPLDDLQRFMIVAVVFGVVVVTAGLVLNIINTWRTGDVRAALVGPKGIAGALLYWVVLVVLVRAFLPASARIPMWVVVALVVTVVALLALAPLIVKFLGRKRPKPPVHATPVPLRLLESSVELVDTLFSFFANTISFVRIAAFAAVHCGIFVAVFAIADTMAALPLGGVLSVAAHVAGNALVILLEGLTVSVQVLRLEYYEFFGKFFRGGGEPYAPLTLPYRRLDHA